MSRLRNLVDGCLAAVLIAVLVAAFVLAFRTLDAVGSSSSCERPGRTVVVDLDNARHGPVLRHAWRAIRRGHPERLTLERDRADARRRAAVAGHPTRPGFDRDEYPPALSRQGGARSSVHYVRSSVNRSAGAVMGAQLSRYCDSTRFRYERRPRAGR